MKRFSSSLLSSVATFAIAFSVTVGSAEKAEAQTCSTYGCEIAGPVIMDSTLTVKGAFTIPGGGSLQPSTDSPISLLNPPGRHNDNVVQVQNAAADVFGESAIRFLDFGAVEYGATGFGHHRVGSMWTDTDYWEYSNLTTNGVQISWKLVNTGANGDGTPSQFHVLWAHPNGDFEVDVPNATSTLPRWYSVAASGFIGIGTSTPGGFFDVEAGTAAALANGVPIILTAQTGGAGAQTTGGDIQLIPGAAIGGALDGAVRIGQKGYLKSNLPTQAASTVAGNPLALSATDAIVGTTNAGAAAGGAVTITGGNAKQLTSGTAQGGAVTITGGAGIGGSQIKSGAVNLAGGWNPGGGGSGQVDGGDINLTSGGDGLSANTIKNSGLLNIISANGSPNTGNNTTGGFSGSIAITTGSGGNASGTTSTGGASGNIVLSTGTPGTGTSAGGAQGTIQMSVSGTRRLEITASGMISSGFGMFGNATALTLSTGEIGLSKITASGSAPGATGGKFALVCGTIGGSAKLIAYAGTSTTPATVVDNIGSGVTGC